MGEKQMFRTWRGLQQPSCTPGPDLTDVGPNHWNCKALGSRTPGSIPNFSAEVSGWVKKDCAGENEDCSKSMCCNTPGKQCFQKSEGWATCEESCVPGVQKFDASKEPWSCKKLGPMWTVTTTTSTTTVTWGFPSLFCFAVSRGFGYEPEILTAQLEKKSGIFACDEYAVLSTDELKLELGDEKLKALHFEPAPVGESKDHTAGNALLFMHVWDTVNSDGRFDLTDWTVKVDPDAVLLPDRLRTHLASRNGESVLRNCNAWPGSGDFPMMYGSLEVLSKKALRTYFDGKPRCDADLPWTPWGEDFYMGKCLMYLGVATEDNFGIISDGVCTQVNCNDGNAAAFHPFKSVDAWMGCFNTAVGAR